MTNNSLYSFVMITSMNKEHCTDNHSKDPFRNRGYLELKYICRIFTNKICEKVECRVCPYSRNDVDNCLVLKAIQKIRGNYE